MKGDDIAVPSTFVIRRDGAIVWHYVGETMMDRPYIAEVARAIEVAAVR